MRSAPSLALAAALLLCAQPGLAQADGAAAPGEAATVDFSFAPPIGTVLRYEQVRSATIDGRTTGARLVHDYRFERHGGRFIVWVELTGIEGLGDDRGARLAETVAAPMRHVRYAVELSAEGEPLAIRDEARVWAHMLDGIARIESEMRARAGIDETERAAMLRLLEAERNRDGAARRAALLTATADMMALAGRRLARGETPHTAETASPLGGSVDLAGTMRVTVPADDIAMVEIASGTDIAGGFAIRERTRYRAAPSSGLVHRMDRTRDFTAPEGSGAPSHSETVSIRLLTEIAPDNPAPAGGG